MRIYTNGTLIRNGTLQRADLACQDGTIVQIANNIPITADCEQIDCSGKYIMPALIDIHTHGAVGYDFNTASLADMHKIMNYYLTHGVGTVLPTIMGDSEQCMIDQIHKVLALASVYSEVEGIHLEGPFISGNKCGAINPEYMVAPSIEMFDRLYQESCGMIKLVTIAPELEGAIELIRYMVDMGVVVSIGHTEATYEVACNAVKNGASSFTHTYNAMSQATQRTPNAVGCALTTDTYCEIIPDYHHVHRSMIEVLYRCKGLDNIIAITDSIAGTGMDEGTYRLGEQDITVKDGKAVLLGQETLAGSTLSADIAISNIAQMLGLTLPQAICTMTANPARLLSIFDKVGSIDVGKRANIFVLG